MGDCRFESSTMGRSFAGHGHPWVLLVRANATTNATTAVATAGDTIAPASALTQRDTDPLPAGNPKLTEIVDI